MQLQQKFEVAISGLIALLCAIFIWESWDLPPGTFEPLGSGPVPQVTASIIILCCGLVIHAAFKKAKEPATENDDDEDEKGAFSIKAGILMAGATFLFVGVLHLRLMPFSWMTAIFLVVTIWGLERFDKKKLLPAIAAGLIVGFAVEYLFTQVFVVDLPT